jgi:hypothetical protein
MRNNRPYSRSQKGEPQAWEKYPRAMLRARAVAECVRSACPEVLHGAIYTAEELGAQVDEAGLPVAAEGFVRQAPGQDAWEQAAPAPVQHATPPPQKGGEQAEREWAQRVGVTPPHEQQAQAAAEPWDAAAEGDLSGGRDWINEATEAPDVAAVRAVWQEAKAAGAIEATLGAIGRIGVAKAAEEKQARETAEQAPDPTPTTAGSGTTAAGATGRAAAPGAPERPAAEPVAATLPGAPAGHAQAEERLRIAASRAHLATVDADFQRVYGLPIEQATAQQLDGFRARIEAAGGAQ